MSNHTTSDSRRPSVAAAETAAALDAAPARRELAVLLLYTATMLVSAALLFVVQPMFARMVLPLLGGSPAVWNTALVFYQVALLVGYGYAYVVSRWLGLRAQLALHVVVLLLPLAVLPIQVPDGPPPATSDPAFWLFGVLAASVGLPFLVVATTSPLLQRWFAATGHRHAVDPYFLYGASNLGSLVALLGYPFVVERWLRLADQSRWWASGYLLLVGLCLTSVAATWAARGDNAVDAAARPDSAGLGVSRRTRLQWLGLAAVPVSLMLSVTTYISTDISAMPLLWVVPLALYLGTFIITFMRRPLLPHAAMTRVLPYAVALLVFVLSAREDITNWALVLVHLSVFTVVAVVCHGELASRRPAAGHLTEFYVWLSLGGALGGVFNSLVAPVVFDHIAEYPLTLMAAVLVAPAVAQPLAGRIRGRSKTGAKRDRRGGESDEAPSGWRAWVTGPRLLDLLLPAAVLVLTAGLVEAIQESNRAATWTERTVMFGPPVLVSLLFTRRRLRFSLALGAVMLASTLYVGGKGTFIFTERTFFGVNRVMLFPSGTYHVLGHGNTMHGAQSLEPSRRREPLTYFYPNGPLGQFFTIFRGDQTKERVAVLGLGAGSIACYREPHQAWTFYEIDPSVVRIATNPAFFTFLGDCAPEARIVLGDGRLTLAGAMPGEYDILISDVFTSDAVPIHLLTREAIALYLDKLDPAGVLLFNISNRHLDLQTVLGNLAADAGLVIRVQHDLSIDPRDAGRGKMASQWAILARTTDALGAIAHDPRWLTPRILPGTSVWTDDFNSLLSVFSWQ